MDTPLTFQRIVPTSRASLNWPTQDSSIGRSSSISRRRSAWPESPTPLVPTMRNRQSLSLPTLTSGRRILEYMEPNLNSEYYPFLGNVQRIGKKSEDLPSLENWIVSRPIYTVVITTPLSEFTP